MAFFHLPSCRPWLHGHYPASIRYYGGSDFSTASLPNALPVEISCIHSHVPCQTYHHQPPRQASRALPSFAHRNHHVLLISVADFAFRSQARRSCPGRIVFICHCGLSGRFRCFPPHLAVTQLLPLLTGSTVAGGSGLTSERIMLLCSARTRPSRSPT